MNKDAGFTLIEILTTLVILSILCAIAVPSLLNQRSKALEAEAKQIIGAANRANQAYFTEKTAFTDDISSLGLGINTETANYSYSLQASEDLQQAIALANPSNTQTLRAYVGGVQLILTKEEEATTTGTICQSERPAAANPDGVQFTPVNEAIGAICGEGYEKLE